MSSRSKQNGVGMNASSYEGTNRSYWLVSAQRDGDDDPTERFLENDIWECRFGNEYRDDVRAMLQGDCIAIKSTHTRNENLPFNNRGESVPVMTIEAVGRIVGNPGDGRSVSVDWNSRKISSLEWYFTTHWQDIYRITTGSDWKTDELIRFTFDGIPQDLNRFLGHPRWDQRYGLIEEDKRFRWTKLYQEIADKLQDYRGDRKPLIEQIHHITSNVVKMAILKDYYADGTTGTLRDICPFTAMATFNRRLKDKNRNIVGKEIAEFLGIRIPVPDAFPGIPVAHNKRTWFFGWEKDRGNDIEVLWKVFDEALRFTEEESSRSRAELIKAYDKALAVKGVAWNLSFGLYWIRPWDFVPLDKSTQDYISRELGMSIPPVDQMESGGGTSYLNFMDDLKSRFDDENFPVHSFPELTLLGWNRKQQNDQQRKKSTDNAGLEQADNELDDPATTIAKNDDVHRKECPAESSMKYSVADIIEEGCFFERARIEHLLERLRIKKNVILQGPPGTGKTWLSKRLAFALIGNRDEQRVRTVQFHPNLSYEDFVRGWRPAGDGKLELADGVFMEAIRVASQDISQKFVIVIEEINRGNPAQIFGELLTLLEADKRSPRDAIELCYPDADGKRRATFIPENFYVIGTMNMADRSLALMDLALRRRFAFVTLETNLGREWREWVIEERGVDRSLTAEISRRISKLNEQISEDSRLGSHFCVGHSYVTPPHRLEPDGTRSWFDQVVKTEIGPLLEEYWYDSPSDASRAIKQLLDGW